MLYIIKNPVWASTVLMNAALYVMAYLFSLGV